MIVQIKKKPCELRLKVTKTQVHEANLGHLRVLAARRLLVRT
jgi:hypothetical protein